MTKEGKFKVNLWNPLHDNILKLDLEGAKVDEIAKIVGKPSLFIINLKKSKRYKDRYEEVYAVMTSEGSAPIELLQKAKLTLLQRVFDFSKQSDDIKIAYNATIWCLERFPEFAAKNVPTVIQNTQINHLSPEDIERHNKVADKLKEVAEILKNGENPNVIEFEEDFEDDTPGEDADLPGGNRASPK